MLQCSILHATKSHMRVLHCSIRLTACSIQSIQFVFRVVIFSWDIVEEALIAFILFIIKHIPKWRFFVQQVSQERRVAFIPFFYTCWSLSVLQCHFFVSRWGIMGLTGNAWIIPILNDEQKDLIKTETLISTIKFELIFECFFASLGSFFAIL